MTAKAAWLHDHGQPAGEASNMAKYAAAEAALAAVDAAIQCHGGNGVSTEYGLIPLWGLARLLRIAPVNREMILNYVAQHSLGLPAPTERTGPSATAHSHLAESLSMALAACVRWRACRSGAMARGHGARRGAGLMPLGGHAPVCRRHQLEIRHDGRQSEPG